MIPARTALFDQKRALAVPFRTVNLASGLGTVLLCGVPVSAHQMRS